MTMKKMMEDGNDGDGQWCIVGSVDWMIATPARRQTNVMVWRAKHAGNVVLQMGDMILNDVRFRTILRLLGIGRTACRHGEDAEDNSTASTEFKSYGADSSYESYDYPIRSRFDETWGTASRSCRRQPVPGS